MKTKQHFIIIYVYNIFKNENVMGECNITKGKNFFSFCFTFHFMYEMRYKFPLAIFLFPNFQ